MEERHEGYQINDNFWPKKKGANMARLEKASSYAAKHGNEPQSKLTIGSKLDPLLIRSKKGKVDDDTDSDYLSDHSPISPLQTVAETERFRDPDVTVRPDNSSHGIRSDDYGCSRKRKSRPGEAVSSSNSWKIDYRQSARLAIAHGSNERDYSRFYWRNSTVASRNTDSDHEDVSYRFPRRHSRSTKYPSRISFYEYMQKLREKMEHENENSITDARVCQVEAPKASSKEIDREKDPEFFIRQKLTRRAKTRVAGPARAQVDQSEEEDQFICSDGVSRIGPNDLTSTVSSAAEHELTWRDWLLRSDEPALSNKCRLKHNRYFDLRTMRPKISQNKHRMSDIRNPTEVDYEPVVFGGGDDDDDEDDDAQINDAIFDCLDSSDNSKEKEKSPAVEGESTSVTNSGPGVKSPSRVSPVDENENRLEEKLGERQTAKPSRSRPETNTTTKPAVKCSPMKPPRANLRASRHPRLTARAIAKRTPPTKPERQSLSKLPREDTSWASPKHALPSEAQGASQATTVQHIRVDKWQEDWSPPRKFFIRPSLSEELLDKIEQEKAEREEKRKKMENLRRDFSLSRLSNEIDDISHEIAGIMGPQTIDQDNGEKKISETPKRVYPNLSLEKPREIERCSPKNLFSTAATLTAKEAMEAKAKLNSSSKAKENRAKTSADTRAVGDSEPAAVPSSPNNNEKTAFSRLCSFNKSGSRAMSFIRNIPRLMSNRRRPNMESTRNNSTKRPAEFAESESVVDISTLTIQTQSPVASPEKSPTHERSIWRFSRLTPAAKRKGPTKTPATDQPKCSNKAPRRMSLCRSWTMKFRKRSRRSVSDVERPEERIVDPDDLSPERSAAVTELLQCADIELTRMYQASKALELCFSMPEFVGSRERVESERQLLVSGLRRKAFLDEVSALADKQEDEADCERAHLVISNLSLPLRESIERMGQGADQADWYVVVASHGRHLWASQAIECPRTGPRLHFPGSAEFFQLLPDFAVSIGVYRLQLRMPSLDHASKYHLPAKSPKNSDRSIVCPSPSNFLSRNEKRRTIGPSSTKHADFGAPGLKQSSFLACGKLQLRLADLSKSPPWPLSGIYPGSPGSSVLQGSIDMTTKCKLYVQVEQSGFVNHGEELGGYTNWNRRWAVLDKRYLRFWNYPDEQYNNGHPLKEIDLADCTSESIGPIDRSLCAKARTILLEIAHARHNVTRDGIFLRSPNDYAIVRNLLSFDTPCELTEWQSKLNHVVSTLRAWNVK
ncbi:uncharacterized protein LOC106648027 isoform X2 [Trichogramma pretiosum]|uniref:uncharacterized protein LOC106648027 isoform X2 n=1 Tax=Trichogramma pretiosum TaxID=7493 RepID=UPI0006C988D2|nr:uncharacterized protein LOC106648027 isoform X2 [Trichogramma pretiosum]